MSVDEFMIVTELTVEEVGKFYMAFGRFPSEGERIAIRDTDVYDVIKFLHHQKKMSDLIPRIE